MSTKRRTAQIGLGTVVSRSVFLLCATALFVFTANGFAAFLRINQSSGWDWWFGWLKAGTPALVIVATLTLALAKWQEKNPLPHLWL